MTSALGTIVSAWCVVAIAFTMVAMLLFKRREPTRALQLHVQWPALLLLRPADHVSDAELKALSLPLDYPGLVEHVVVGSAELKSVGGVSWLRSTPTLLNRKLAHLQHALRTIPHSQRVVVAIDMDVLVDGALLRSLVQPWLNTQSPLDSERTDGPAVVYAAPSPVISAGISAGLSAGLEATLARSILCHTLHSFRVLSSVSASTLCGKAMALSPRGVSALLAVDDCIAEDLRLADLVQNDIVLAERSAYTQPSPLMSRFVRWMQVLRVHRPLAFLSVPFLFSVVPFMAIACACGLLNPLLLTALVLLRAKLAHALEREGWQWFLVAECALLLAFVQALFSRHITWRDRLLLVAHGGRILSEERI